MRTLGKTILAATMLMFATDVVVAQRPDDEPRPRRQRERARDRERQADDGQRPGPARDRGPRGPGGRPRFVLPLMAALDTDNDGELSMSEIENAVAALKKLDKDGNGTVSREELRPEGFGPGGFGRGGFGGPGGGGPGGFIARLMENDKNGDGKLSKDEVPERMQRIFDRADGNGDGTIDKAELEQMSQQFGRRGGGRGQGGGRRQGGGDRPQRPAAE